MFARIARGTDRKRALSTLAEEILKERQTLLISKA
jgi:hypothetical protein